jgi:adenylate cyclase
MAEKWDAFMARIRRVDGANAPLLAAQRLRGLLPGDAELGDPLSTAGDEPPQLLARRLAEVTGERPSITREVGLGAIQMWQAFSEKQGRGRGERELAIVFTDLVDFSTWALDAGDEAALDLLRKVGREEEDAICSRGGRVVKRLGDGAMAVFADPHAAVDAARDTRSRIAGLEVEGYVPRMRAGVHVGRPRKIGGDYVGVDVNVAARVAAAADADQILVSGQVCERLEPDAFEFKRRRRFKAKGAPKELEVFSLESSG